MSIINHSSQDLLQLRFKKLWESSIIVVDRPTLSEKVNLARSKRTEVRVQGGVLERTSHCFLSCPNPKARLVKTEDDMERRDKVAFNPISRLVVFLSSSLPS